ncbi:hypothetical protein [Levilactobacillus sp. HBUAS70063]
MKRKSVLPAGGAGFFGPSIITNVKITEFVARFEELFLKKD